MTEEAKALIKKRDLQLPLKRNNTRGDGGRSNDVDDNDDDDDVGGGGGGGGDDDDDVDGNDGIAKRLCF